MGAGRDVRLGADDGLDSGGRRRAPEVVGAEDVAVVGDRDGGHPLLDGGIDERFDTGRAIQHRILAVHVQMHEGIVARWHYFSV
jgi:hypothetical protein